MKAILSRPFSSSPSCLWIIFLLLAFLCSGLHSKECTNDKLKSCCEENLGACGGCTDPDLQECVCKLDKRCCNDVWDSLCVYHATRDCNAKCSCRNSCSTTSGYIPPPPPKHLPFESLTILQMPWM